MTSKAEEKQRIRSATLARRDALDLAWRTEVALKVAGEASLLGTQPGDVVSGFWPIRSELDLRPLMDALRKTGARVTLPAILDRETIVFRELVPGAPLVDMGFGTRGPDEAAEVLDPEILLVPLSAFDGNGNRIGYGAGHYDRAIAKLVAKGVRPRLVGIAFDCQEVDCVPAEEHDMPLQAIWTESGLRKF